MRGGHDECWTQKAAEASLKQKEIENNKPNRFQATIGS